MDLTCPSPAPFLLLPRLGEVKGKIPQSKILLTDLQYVYFKKINPAVTLEFGFALNETQIYCGYTSLSMQTTLLAERAIM